MANERTGDVWVTDFDRGVIETLGAVVNTDGDTYIVKDLTGVDSPPEYEGVPVYFAFPDDVIDNKILPSFVIRRDSFVPAMNRWHLGAEQYRVPAFGANPITINHPITGSLIKSGFSKYEIKDQAVPFDIVYTIQIRARFRNNLRVEGLKMLRHALKKFQPYTTIYLHDSLGDLRSYDAFMETPNPSDTKSDVANRETNFNITVRVEAELDLNDPVVVQALTSIQTSLQLID